MSNSEIISTHIALLGIMEPVNTYAGWQRNGYTVRRGEKATFKTKIWKPCKVKDEETKETGKKLIMVNAAFFTASQVEKI